MAYDTAREGTACAEPWLLLDHCGDVVVVTDYAFRVIYRNASESRLLPDLTGCTPGEILWDVFPRNNGDVFQEELRAAMETRRPCVMTADFPSAGRVAVRGFPHGEGAFALFLRDLSERDGVSAVREDASPYVGQETASYTGESKVVPAGHVAPVPEIEAGKEFQRRFLTEVLANVTDGRLRLCSWDSDLPVLLPAVGAPISLTTPQTLASFRRRIEAAGVVVGIPSERTRELLTAAGEAAMNGIVHAGGATATLHGVPGGGRMQVCVVDAGSGIADENLHRATLERGYTTAGSLGLGFSLMHAVADRVYLLTRDSGTIVVIEQDAVRPSPEETRFQLAFA